MHKLSLRGLSEALKKRELTSIELTEHFLARINNHPEVNAFISVNEENALRRAKIADHLLQNGQGSALTGIPFAHKDIFCTQQIKTTCASKMLADFVSPYDAGIVKKLAQEHTILLGKTNMDEFAMGSANENSHFGPVKNPWNPDHVPGGSSGGSAAAVAAALAPFATGSDTGGSIRQPAAFCGISGLKPTYGLASRYGMIAFASSLDQAGPMAKSADDLALVMQAMAGYDPNDSTSIDKPVPDFSSEFNKPIKSLRIGIPACFFQQEVETEIQQAIKSALNFYEAQGAELVEIDLPLQPYWVPCYYVIACAEASSNLSRYDGIRYGYRATDPENLLDLITRSRDEGFGIEVKRRILTGTYVLSSGYFDAYYVHAQKVRRMIQNELLNALEAVDVILGPTTPTCAFKLGEEITDPTKRYLADVFTVAANLAGLPAISLPAGFNADNLPIGMQMMGKPFSESILLGLAHRYQQETNWHKAMPEEFK